MCFVSRFYQAQSVHVQELPEAEVLFNTIVLEANVLSAIFSKRCREDSRTCEVSFVNNVARVWKAKHDSLYFQALTAKTVQVFQEEIVRIKKMFQVGPVADFGRILRGYDHCRLWGGMPSEMIQTLHNTYLYLEHPKRLLRRLQSCKSPSDLNAIKQALADKIYVDQIPFENLGLYNSEAVLAFACLMGSSLEYADFNGIRNTNKDLNKLVEYCPNLTTLKVVFLDDEGMWIIRPLSKLERLITIVSRRPFAEGVITDEGLMHLSEFVCLQELVVQSQKITERGLSYIAAAKNLISLGLVEVEVTRTGLEHLANLRLERLSFRRCLVMNDQIEVLEQFQTLRELSIDLEFLQFVRDGETLYPPFTDVGMESIGRLANLEKITFE